MISDDWKGSPSLAVVFSAERRRRAVTLCARAAAASGRTRSEDDPPTPPRRLRLRVGKATLAALPKRTLQRLPPEVTDALLSIRSTSVVAEVAGGYALSEFGRLRPLLERRV